MLREGLIQKNKGLYSLTTPGKEFANRLDTDALKLERQAKLAIAIHAVRVRGDHPEYLVHHRLKEPFYGWYGSHSGKIRWGESPLETARREFLEETGLTGDFTLKCIAHYCHFHKNGQFLEDKYFWVYRVDHTTGKLKTRVPEGENIWMTEAQIRAIKNIFATFDEMMEDLNSPTLVYLDRTRIVDSY